MTLSTPCVFASLATTLLLHLPFALGDHCRSDLDGNNLVDGADLTSLLGSWGDCTGECGGDINNDGRIDGADLTIMLGAWGDCPDDGGGDGSGPFNYGEALQKAITFYYAQRAGDLPEDYPLNWRGDAFNYELEQENGQYEVDAGIINRYMDAGDTPTFVLPISSAMTTMAWGGIEFRDGFTNASQLDNLLDTLRWHADWCIAAHPEPNVFCGQIGQGGPSHGFWGPVEVHTEADGYRPKIWWLTPEYPGSEPAGEAAAFLAAASILFQEQDPGYAASLLQHSRELYSFANTYQGTYTDSIPEVASFYNSFSGYKDELAWAAAWLYRATGEASYLADARVHFAAASPDPHWAQSWDGKINGAACLLAGLTGEAQFKNAIETNLNHWQPGGGISYTSGGLAWLSTWGSLRYAANTSFLACAYAEMVGDPDGRYRSFAESQINYILGDNPRNSSYVCGFGTNFPIHPHHRSAHGSWNNQINDPAPNRHTLWGALVGGPASADDFDYADVRSDYVANEVTCDYNAGFVASLGYMAQAYGGNPLPDADFPPVEDAYGEEMFVEASIIEDADTFTSLRCMLNNRSAWPARLSDALSYRIYLDLTEVLDAGYDVQDVFISSGFTDGGTVSGLQLANASTNLYFVEIAYDGEFIGPGLGSSYRRECQVSIGLDDSAPISAWNPNNDPSISNLPSGQSAITKTDMISVYDAGALVYGNEGLADCNNNGIPDSDEIADGTAEDIDGNGRPDECDPDCDGDGVVDRYAIDQGLVGDCDSDFIPDSCEIADGASDADENGVPDICEVEGFNAQFRVQDDWGTGFVAELIITNNSGQTVAAAWTLECEVQFVIDNLWGGDLQSQTDGHVIVVAPEWSNDIADGGSITIGFQGIYSDTIFVPEDVTLNGSPVFIE